MNHLADKTIVITGAASGFGRLIAVRCAAGGARVVGVDVDSERLTEVIEGIRAAGRQATFHVADVSDIDQMHTVAAHAVQEHGSIDVLVNNAGVMPLAYLSDHREAIERWHKSIDINLKGTLNGVCAVHDQMLTQGRGHIVNISSIYGNAGIEGAAVYSATKAAIATLSDAVRIETQGRIKVSTVRPTGVFGTNLHTWMVDRTAMRGLVGNRADQFTERVKAHLGGELPAELDDRNSVRYWLIKPEDLADAVVDVIDQPWGVNISDITVRATGEDYVF